METENIPFWEIYRDKRKMEARLPKEPEDVNLSQWNIKSSAERFCAAVIK